MKMIQTVPEDDFPERSQLQPWKRDASFGICKILNLWNADKYFHEFMHMHARWSTYSTTTTKRHKKDRFSLFPLTPASFRLTGIRHQPLIRLPVCVWMTWRRIKRRRAAGNEGRGVRAKVQDGASHMGFHTGLLSRSTLKLLHLFTV